jgi:hypothetical protein
MKKLFERVKPIFTNPKESVRSMMSEEVSIVDLFREYILILCVIPCIATFLFGLGGPQDPSLFNSLVIAILVYLIFVFGIWLTGYLMVFFGLKFGAEIDLPRGLMVSAAIWTPFLVASIIWIFPNFSKITILAMFYGVFIFYLASQEMIKTEKEKRAAFIGVIGAIMLITWYLGYLLYYSLR